MRESNPVEAASRRFPTESVSCRFLSNFFNPLAPVEITSANLPHWRQHGVIYFVTFRLVDALPQEKLAQWAEERALWLESRPRPLSDLDKAEYQQRFTAVMEHWLDQGSGSCVLRQPECRGIVERALHHFDGERYHLGQYVVAPNHVHVLVEPFVETDLSQALHSWKSFTAKKILKLDSAVDALSGHWSFLRARLRRPPKTQTPRPVWQKESYDHIVRSPDALAKIEQYIQSHK